MTLRKLALSLFCLVAVCVVAIGGYLWSTYIDESVSEGSAYGFSIGQTKREAFGAASGALRQANPGDTRIFVQDKVSGETASALGVPDGFVLMHETLLHESSYESFSERDRWTFFFSASFRDTLSVKFCGDAICKIYRHRQHFEIP